MIDSEHGLPDKRQAEAGVFEHFRDTRRFLEGRAAGLLLGKKAAYARGFDSEHFRECHRHSSFCRYRPLHLSRGVEADASDRRTASELLVCIQPDAAQPALPSRPGDKPPSSMPADETAGHRYHL